MFTRLFAETAARPASRRQFPVRMVLANAAAAAACAVCALAYLAESIAAGDYGGPPSLEVRVFLWSTGIVVVAIGIVLGAFARSFPWLTTVLTPLFSALTFALPAGRGDVGPMSVAGLVLGCIASALFLLGASAAWTLKRRVRNRMPSSRQ